MPERTIPAWLDPASLLDASALLNLMAAVADPDLILLDATTEFAEFLGQPLAGKALIEVLPLLAGTEEELKQIACGAAGAWRIPGLLLAEDAQRQCDILFLPRAGQPGLLIVGRRMDAEALVEQTLRQQRNELALLHEKLEAQTSALRTAKDRLESMDRERRGLMNLIAHDIKSALAIMLGYAEWLSVDMQSVLQTAHIAALEHIMQSTQRMAAAIDNVQALERIEQRLAEMSWQPVDLVAQIENVKIMLHEKAQLQGMRIEFEIEKPVPSVLGDAQLLREALIEVVTTALLHARQARRLLLRLTLWDRWAILRVDTEQGLPVPDAPTSLALAKSRLIAEGHGGHLAIEKSKPLHGIIALWLLAPDAQDAQVWQRRDATTLPNPASPTPSQTSPAPGVLVVAEGHLRINTSSQRVWVDNKPVTLSTSEYRLLVYLAEHADQVITHDQILDTVWSFDESVSLDNLRVLIWRLRQKIADTEQPTPYLRTVRGFGYVLSS